MAEIRNVVNQVLSQLGTSREARYYLNQYSEDDLQFAVIKIGPSWKKNGITNETMNIIRGQGRARARLLTLGPTACARLSKFCNSVPCIGSHLFSKLFL